jgi:enterochelin esterase-like enzyme
MPYIEKTYRIRREKHYRAVAGLSMGGRGTYVYALHHPELFSSACPLSAGTGPERLQDVKAYLKRFKKKNYENLPDSLFRSYYERNSVLYLITNVPDTTMKDVRWYIDCGDDDILYEGNSRVHIVMRKRKIPHEYRVRDGAHNWTYWRSALPDVLKFVSKAFHNF